MFDLYYLCTENTCYCLSPMRMLIEDRKKSSKQAPVFQKFGMATKPMFGNILGLRYCKAKKARAVPFYNEGQSWVTYGFMIWASHIIIPYFNCTISRIYC